MRAPADGNSRECQDWRVYRRHLIPWSIGAAVICAGLGAWGGQQLGDGRSGNVALVSVAGGVLGSFLPGAVSSARTRLRDHRPHHRAT